MANQMITSVCSKGHKSTLRVEGQPRAFVDMLAAMMDGSAYPPIPADLPTSIGRCAWEGCGAPFKCDVTEIEEKGGPS